MGKTTTLKEMAALVQTLPPQTTSPLLSGRPSSSGGYTAQNTQHQGMRGNNMSRYNNQTNQGYRGLSSTGPVAPYAFTSTPQLAGPRGANPGHAPRSASASLLPQTQPLGVTQAKVAPQKPHSSSTSPSLNSSVSLDFSKVPALDLSFPVASPPPTLNSPTAPKPSPDRYRRNVRRVDSSESSYARHPQGSAIPSGSGMAAVGQLYSHPTQTSSSPSLTQYHSYRGSVYTTSSQPAKASADDTAVGRSKEAELAARYRRRSFGSIETPGLTDTHEGQDAVSPHPNVVVQKQAPGIQSQTQKPSSSHAHTGSAESVASSRSGRSGRPASARKETYAQVASHPPPHISQAAKQDMRLLSPPNRSAETNKRNPSPLSRPVNADEESRQTRLQQTAAPSPAVEQLAALNQKESKKSKSKLRRAFSFGSAAELRKATAHANLEKNVVATQTSNKRSSKYEDEGLEPEQARIAEKQEAAGLGESIYSGQGNFFTGSTDNLSISSTASSASVMLRKMGKGVKKGTRSLVGLFRPKSVVGVPAADGPVNQGSAAQVSMVTVEAEREKVNVNLNPHDQAGGGTGFPKLERNSIDNRFSTESGTVSSDNRSRKSMVGGEKERAEVLAAVKKGILKRTDSDRPSPGPRPLELNLPNIPNVPDSPRSSAPSTPVDEPPRSGHRRTDSITIEGNDHDDYFASVTAFTSLDSKTATPPTPQASLRNISFSPRIQFHDTYPGGEYDRRGDIATCNRLTPMLAQQIKEELNTFKMVSWVTLQLIATANTWYRRWKSTSRPKSTLTSSDLQRCRYSALSIIRATITIASK